MTTGETTMASSNYVSVGPIVICRYTEDCCDVLTDKCKRCAHNRKRSYFCPVDYWPRPYDYIPYWPYHITYGTGGDDSWSYTTSSHFVEAK